MEHVSSIGHLERRLYTGMLQETAVEGSMTPARLVPFVQVAKLHAQDRALNPVHAVIVPLENMMVLALLSPIPEHAHCADEALVVGDHDAALAVPPQVLSRIEAETSEIAE